MVLLHAHCFFFTTCPVICVPICVLRLLPPFCGFGRLLGSSVLIDSPIGFGGTITREWRVYDVGGQRSLVCTCFLYPLFRVFRLLVFLCSRDISRVANPTPLLQRAAWAPYFDDVNCILFLAPISAFDQVLAEDITVNRLEDSVLLWKSICQNKLLASTNVVLFLNKTDILKAKLESGIRFADHLVSYGDRPNDYENTSKCALLFNFPRYLLSIPLSDAAFAMLCIGYGHGSVRFRVVN